MSNARSTDDDGAQASVRRGEHARRRVLEAALAQLAEEGASRFSMDRVAARAHASKATLYRRWPGAAALLVDAMEHAFQPFPVPDTGDVRTDLRQLLYQAIHRLTNTPFPRLLAAVADLAERDPTLADTHAGLTVRQRAPLLRVLQRGKERGQLHRGTDVDVLADVMVGPLFYRRFVAHQPLTPGYLDAIIEQALGGTVPERTRSQR